MCLCSLLTSFENILSLLNEEVGCWNRLRYEAEPWNASSHSSGPQSLRGGPPLRFPCPIQVKSPLHRQIFHSSGSVKKSWMGPGQTRWAGPQKSDTHGRMNANVFKHEGMKRKQSRPCLGDMKDEAPTAVAQIRFRVAPSSRAVWLRDYPRYLLTKSTRNTAECAAESALSPSKDAARRSKQKICSFVCINGHQNRLNKER